MDPYNFLVFRTIALFAALKTISAPKIAHRTFEIGTRNHFPHFLLPSVSKDLRDPADNPAKKSPTC